MSRRRDYDYEKDFGNCRGIGGGSFTVFFTRPVSLIFMIIGLALFLLPMLPFIKRKPLAS
jgi:TctA family transporter